MEARSIFSTGGPIQELQAILAQHVVKHDWLRMTAVVETRSQKQQRLIKLGPLVQQLTALQANLSFSPKVMKDALKTVVESSDFKSSLESIDKWVKSHQEQLAADLRGVQQARNKRNPPVWLKALARNKGPIKFFASSASAETMPAPIGDEEEELDEEEEEEEEEPHEHDEETTAEPAAEPAFERATPQNTTIDSSSGSPNASPKPILIESPTPKPPSNQEFVVGWAGDASWPGNAWRAPIIRGKVVSKEFSTKIDFDPNDLDQPVWATFADGSKHKIDEMPGSVYCAQHLWKSAARDDEAPAAEVEAPAQPMTNTIFC